MHKNTQLLLAYTCLFSSAVAAVTYDSHWRSVHGQTLSEAEMKAEHRRASGTHQTRVVSVPQPLPSDVSNLEVVIAPPSNPPQLPRGVFLVKETMTVQSTDGRSSELAAGTQVSLLRQDNGKMKVTRDGQDYLLEEAKLTRDSKTVAMSFQRKG